MRASSFILRRSNHRLLAGGPWGGALRRLGPAGAGPSTPPIPFLEGPAPAGLRPGPAAAFTLLEILLTTAILGLILPMLMFFVLNLSEIWLKGVNGDFFPQHVDGVSLFLRQALERSEMSVGNGLDGESTLPVEWARPPGFNDFDDPLLMFRQIEAPALFVRDGESLPNLYVYLYFDKNDGLSLLWYSSHDEEVEETSDLNRTTVSPFVTGMEYCYYDDENDEWEITVEPKEEDDVFFLPQFLKLTFAYEGSVHTRNILIPQRNSDVPTF